MTAPIGRRGALAAALGLLLLGSGVAAATTSSAAVTVPAPDRHSHDADRPAPPGYRTATDGPCAGMLEVKAVPGACTHGPDAPFPGYEIAKPVAPAYTDGAPGIRSVVCDGDGTSGNRVQVLYVRGAGTTSRLGRYAASFRGWAADVDKIFDDSARQTGGTRHVRYVTDAACAPSVTEVVIGDSQVNDVGDSVNAIKKLGYQRTDRKYLMFVDADELCGVAFVNVDSQPGQNNANNRGPSFARVDNGCWGASTAGHELTHALGSVNSDSPNHTEYGHCTDDYDLMCYDDGPGTQMRIVCTDPGQDDLLDCNKDDYFSTNPKPGSYLDKHWNTANNRFLITS
jgi:hypothetical protein